MEWETHWQVWECTKCDYRSSYAPKVNEMKMAKCWKCGIAMLGYLVADHGRVLIPLTKVVEGGKQK